MLKKIILIASLMFLSGCYNSEIDKTINDNYLVALYQDGTSKDDILAIFPGSNVEATMNNCKGTVKLYEEDDKTNGYRPGGSLSRIRTMMGFAPGSAPVYFCRAIKK